jgi:hypothetical protein
VIARSMIAGAALFALAVGSTPSLKRLKEGRWVDASSTPTAGIRWHSVSTGRRQGRASERQAEQAPRRRRDPLKDMTMCVQRQCFDC